VNKEISYAAGKIIFMSSVHDIIPWEGHVNYAVSPGAIRTPMNVEKLTTPEAFDKELLKLMPAGRIGEPEDVSRATVWLVSDDSDYINGQTIYIDGGMTLYPGFIGGG
jgi:glucose 1-dehydrogenase